MPEGHVLHRAARLQRSKFTGHRLAVASPQGRFADGAARLDSQRLDDIRAHGKHIFYGFESGDQLHVHLGLFGKFKVQSQPAPEPSPNARVILDGPTHRLHLAGPTTCEVLEPDEVQAITERLGPDPILDPPDGAERLAHLLGRRSIPIGRALLVQEVIAGIGNVYRSEILFKAGIDPWVSAKELNAPEVDALWKLTVDELTLGERRGRIVTTEPAEFGVDRVADLARAERLYAYKRHGDPCHRCGTPIASADIDGRNIWWCPSCQPAR